MLEKPFETRYPSFVCSHSLVLCIRVLPSVIVNMYVTKFMCTGFADKLPYSLVYCCLIFLVYFRFHDSDKCFGVPGKNSELHTQRVYTLYAQHPNLNGSLYNSERHSVKIYANDCCCCWRAYKASTTEIYI